MLELEYTPGSPYARAIRILLDELGMGYSGSEPASAPTGAQLGTDTPTMQVPTLRDGNVVLWESGVIAEYLLGRTANRPDATPPLAKAVWRPSREWEDRLLFATIQTFGTAVTTISQLTWTGVTIPANAHLQRCAERAQLILTWLEGRLEDAEHGFLLGTLSVQDIFLACHVRFAEARPLGLTFDMARHPKIDALLGRLDARRSFIDNPVWWWDPEVVDYTADGTPVYGSGR